MAEMSIAAIAPIIAEVVSSGAEFRLYPRGKSMYPTIIEGEDSVVLSAPVKLEVRDAVFYKRESGQYVLHRIVKVRRNSYDMCGDNQVAIEKKVPSDCVIAKMSGIYKKDEYISTADENYRKEIKRLCRKKVLPRFLYSVKVWVYPVYKAIFK